MIIPNMCASILATVRHLALLLICNLPAQTLAAGALITVEPDDFAEGQALTNVVPGVSLSVANGSGVVQPNDEVVAFRSDYPSTGDLVFGRQIAGLLPDDNWFLTEIFVHSVFRVDFAPAVSHVAIDAIRQDASGEAAALLAYDAAGTLLDTAVISLESTGASGTARINRPTADIAYALAGGYPVVSAPPYHIVALDHLQFGAEPTMPTTMLSQEYFPLLSGDQWIDQIDGDPGVRTTTTVLPSTYMVNGVATKAVREQGPFGTSVDYMTNDSNGIRLHKEDVEGDTIIFNPPIQMGYASATLGQQITSSGTATLYLPAYGSFVLDYTSAAKAVSVVSTSVPAGQYDTVRLDWTFTVSGMVNGQPISETSTTSIFLAQHIGPVRQVVWSDGQATEYELISALIDHDVDGITATEDNCPAIANPDQRDTDADGAGDACDLDDDNDGLTDDDEASWSTDPLDPDSDGDGMLDGEEVEDGRNPAVNEPAILNILNLILSEP